MDIFLSVNLLTNSKKKKSANNTFIVYFMRVGCVVHDKQTQTETAYIEIPYFGSVSYLHCGQIIKNFFKLLAHTPAIPAAVFIFHSTLKNEKFCVLVLPPWIIKLVARLNYVINDADYSNYYIVQVFH